MKNPTAFLLRARDICLSATERAWMRAALKSYMMHDVPQRAATPIPLSLTKFWKDTERVGLRRSDLWAIRGNLLAFMRSKESSGKGKLFYARVDPNAPMLVPVWTGVNLFKHLTPFAFRGRPTVR